MILPLNKESSDPLLTFVDCSMKQCLHATSWSFSPKFSVHTIPKLYIYAFNYKNPNRKQACGRMNSYFTKMEAISSKSDDNAIQSGQSPFSSITDVSTPFLHSSSTTGATPHFIANCRGVKSFWVLRKRIIF